MEFNPYFAAHQELDPWDIFNHNAGPAFGGFGGPPRDPPDFVRRLMYQHLALIFARSFGDSFGAASIELIFLELLGDWQKYLKVAVAFVALFTQVNLSASYLGLLVVFIYPLMSHIGSSLFLHAVYTGTNSNSGLLAGASQLVLPYAQDEVFVVQMAIAASVPYIITGIILPLVYRLITLMISNYYMRLSILLGPKIPSTIVLLARLLAFIAPPIREHGPQVTRRLIKISRRCLVFSLELADAVALWRILERSKRMVEQLQEKPGRCSKYVYTALGKRQIRVLKITPQSEILLKCTLETISLDEQSRESYEAVSYRWPAGNQEAVYPILIGDNHFLVAKTVLKLLRGVQDASRTKTIWIDYLCINQADEEEKKTQIPLMRDVYRGAQGVIAWFGDSREGMGAITILKQMAAAGQPAKEELHHMIHGLFPFELYSWQKVIEFLRHEYFTRMWMIQEVALAKTVVMKHGKEEMEWSQFATFIPFFHSPAGERFLHEPGYFTQWWVDPRVLEGIKNALMMVMVQDLISREQIPTQDILDMPVQMRSMQEAANGALQKDGLRGLPIEILLGLTTDFQATVPEDKIYAILGLTHQTTVPEDNTHPVVGPTHQTSQEIEVQYGDSVESTSAIIRNVARRVLLSDEETLEQFHLAGWGYRDFATPTFSPKWSVSDAAILNLPSWVPEWHQKQLNKPCIQGAVYLAGKADPSVMKRISAVPGAGGENLNLISVRMSRVGRIQSVGAGFPILNDGDIGAMQQHLRSFVEDARRLVQGVVHNRYTPQPTEEALWRTIFGDCTAGSLPPLEKNDLERLRTAVELQAGLRPQPALLNQEQTQSFYDSFFEIGRSLLCHSFCVTDDGHFGLVPSGSKPGDAVFIIWGAPTPFVVRSRASHEKITRRSVDESPDNGENILVGSCYLHGFMLGEATTAQYPPEDIILR